MVPTAPVVTIGAPPGPVVKRSTVPTDVPVVFVATTR
jgi:hypothetical protein